MTDLLASLQPNLVWRWAADASAGPTRTIDGTVVSADISGFTRLAESLVDAGPRLAAETLNATINRCFDPMIDEIVEACDWQQPKPAEGELTVHDARLLARHISAAENGSTTLGGQLTRSAEASQALVVGVTGTGVGWPRARAPRPSITTP